MAKHFCFNPSSNLTIPILNTFSSSKHSMNNGNAESRPITPSDSDCCGNGCDPCIFDIHKKLVDEWENRQLGHVSFTSQNNLLAATKYSTFSISNVTECSIDCILLELHYKGATKRGTRLSLRPGQHVMLRGPSVTRPFTPLSCNNNSLVILAKIYSNGQFSQYLKQLSIEDEIDARGPYGDFVYKPNSFEHVIMFGIGTGIAALYPIAKSITDEETDETMVHLVAGFRSYLHIPLKKELRSLSDYWNIKCTLWLSQEDGEVGLSGVKLEKGRLEKGIILDLLKSLQPECTLVLICGTPEFNESVRKWTEESEYYHVHVFE